ncbi:MAG TPA: hypothetical protein VM778_02740 [Gemmatimonadota bacterium]|nr:hypothetical protein [Gemmatimonadota bacterium]
MRLLLLPLAAAVLLAIPATATAQTDEPTFDAMRAATEKYADAEAALADGYIPDPTGMCVDATMVGLAEEVGGMGIHYFRPDRFQITAMEPRVDGTGTHTDFLQPGILLYEPQADGSLVLVGIENLVFEEAWQAGHEGPPVLHGQEWERMANDPETEMDEAHGFTPHYDQHVWLFRENPAGALQPFNPAVTCEHAGHGDPGMGAEAGS